MEFTVHFILPFSLVIKTVYANMSPFCLSREGFLHDATTDVDSTD